jgi:hypothetical protein
MLPSPASPSGSAAGAAAPASEGWLAREPWAPRSKLLSRALAFLIVLACLSAIGAMLIVPAGSKAVGLVYGGF